MPMHAKINRTKINPAEIIRVRSRVVSGVGRRAAARA